MFFNPVRYDWEICHFDSQGNIILNKTLGYTNGDEFGKDIISIGNNEFLIGGFTKLLNGVRIWLFFMEITQEMS